VRRITTTLACLGSLALAAPAQAEVRELGVGDNAPLVDAACPTDCQAIGRVSGFPVQIGSTKNPFLVNTRGKVVAFTLRLGKPNAEQTSFFSNLFGGQAQVRLSVLKPWRKGRRHRLVRQSEVVNVQDYFGSTPTFALAKPLRIVPRNIVALTVPTWVPAFAVNQPSSTAWRFSRENCDNAEEPAAQQSLKSNRTYACFKRTARPLYTVTFIPDPKKTSSSSDSRSGDDEARRSSSNSDSRSGGVRP
jgi:hypothetical protein